MLLLGNAIFAIISLFYVTFPEKCCKYNSHSLIGRKVTMKNKKGERELTFMLYNYPNMDKLIENRKLELIDKINTSCYEWNRSKTSITSNTIDDIVDNFETDYTLNRLAKWKETIEKYLKGISYNNLIRRFINNKYFLNASTNEVMKHLNINYNEYCFLDNIIKKSLYKMCEKEKLYT